VVDKMLALTGQLPSVQIAVVMPTPEKQAQREADHKRMDALTAQLQRRLGPGGRVTPVFRRWLSVCGSLEASVSLAECEGGEVIYVAARLKDVVSSAAQVHGWNQPAVNVNIANIPMPTEEERAEMRA
jgi:hypothetical protein